MWFHLERAKLPGVSLGSELQITYKSKKDYGIRSLRAPTGYKVVVLSIRVFSDRPLILLRGFENFVESKL